MTKNNSNWLEIAEEFKNRYLLRGIPGYEMRHVQMCEDMLEFFKPYFQEQMHEEAVQSLEHSWEVALKNGMIVQYEDVEIYKTKQQVFDQMFEEEFKQWIDTEGLLKPKVKDFISKVEKEAYERGRSSVDNSNTDTNS